MSIRICGWIKSHAASYLIIWTSCWNDTWCFYVDQQINDIPWAMSTLSLSLSFFCRCFLSYIVSLSLSPQRLLGVFLLNILDATRHAERIIKKQGRANIIGAFGIERVWMWCRADSLIYSTAESAAQTKCRMQSCVCGLWMSASISHFLHSLTVIFGCVTACYLLKCVRVCFSDFWCCCCFFNISPTYKGLCVQ